MINYLIFKIRVLPNIRLVIKNKKMGSGYYPPGKEKWVKVSD